jgi:hypothetical protein
VRPHITHEANGCVYRLDNVAFQGRKLVMAKSINRILNNRVDSIGNERVMFSFNDIASGAQPLGHARLNGGLEFSVSRFQRHRRANGRVELRKLFDSVHLQALGLLQERARRFRRLGFTFAASLDLKFATPRIVPPLTLYDNPISAGVASQP